MRTSDLRHIILKSFKNREFYGYDIHKKLTSTGVNIDVGRVYKVLNQMQKDGWLESRWEKSSFGPKKKLYKLGKKGKNELDIILINAIRTIHKAYGEYLFGLPVEKDVFNVISNIVACKKPKRCNVVLITDSPSPMYQKLLGSIQHKIVKSKIFIVKPKAMAISLNLQNIVNIEGDFENIPFKDNYVDLLLATSIPRNEIMESAVKEWYRVINNEGKVAILSPNVLFGECDDPLRIGDFIEKWEHQIFENRATGEGKTLLSYLKKYFQKIEDKNIVHMKLVLATGPRDQA
jgi:PadR family transcriptional regulator PadR